MVPWNCCGACHGNVGVSFDRQEAGLNSKPNVRFSQKRPRQEQPGVFHQSHPPKTPQGRATSLVIWSNLRGQTLRCLPLRPMTENTKCQPSSFTRTESRLTKGLPGESLHSVYKILSVNKRLSVVENKRETPPGSSGQNRSLPEVTSQLWFCDRWNTQLENEDCGQDLHWAQMKLQYLSFQLIPVLSGDVFERVHVCLH